MCRGIHPSAVPCGFWILCLCSECPLLRIVILLDKHKEVSSCSSNPVHLLWLSALGSVSVWSLVTDVFIPTRLFLSEPLVKGMNDHDSTSLLSRITFTWMIKPEIAAFKRILSLSDLFTYSPGQGCKSSLHKLDQWVNKRAREKGQLTSRHHQTLILAVLRLVLPPVLLSFLARTLAMVVKVFQLYIFRDLIGFFEGEKSDAQQGLYLTAQLTVTNLIQLLLPIHYFYSSHYASGRLRSILSALVMRKFLSLPAAARHTFMTDMTSYMTVDVQKIAAVFSEANCGYEIFILGPAAIFILWGSFGVACIVGVFVFSLVVFLNSGPLRTAMQKIKAEEMAAKVKRIGLIQSILTGIKVLKFNAWEKIFEQKIEKTREEELCCLRKSSYIQAASNTLSLLAPYLVITSALVLYIFLFPSRPISSEKIFVAMAAVDNTLIFVVHLPIAAAFFAQGYVSGKRLIAFIQVDHGETKSFNYTKDYKKKIKPKTPLKDCKSEHSVIQFNSHHTGNNTKKLIGINPKEFTKSTKGKDIKYTGLPLGKTKFVVDDNKLQEDEPFTNDIEDVTLSMHIDGATEEQDSIEMSNIYDSGDEGQTGSVILQQASFSWNNSRSAVLNSIDLRIDPGLCVAVVGRVGAGKSSLLSAILGEMNQLEGSRSVKGNIGYVPQEPWILQATIRDNIILGSETCIGRMNQIIHACALDRDIQTFTGGINTEVGECGVTLSGGQKQRVSLARALYADADIYLLDDPLSAVDAKVAKHIFEEVIGPHGLLKNKTRILVTHALQWLPCVDLIVVMEDGHVTQISTFTELTSRDALFTNYIQYYNNDSCTMSRSEVTKSDVLLTKTSPGFTGPSLMTEELMEHSKTSLRTLLNYIQSMGPGRAAAILVFLVLVAVTMSASNIWVTRWSGEWKTNPSEALKNTHYRLGVHVALGALNITLMVFGLVFMARSSLTSAANLHHDLLSRVLRATLTFFERTPSGRILNWFSKDTDDIDISLPKELWFQVYSVPPILSMLAISTYVVPASLLVTVPMLAGFIGVQRLYTNYVLQVMRIDGVAKSPVFSLFNETLKGVVSIRAYRKTEYFCDRFYKLVDDSTRPMWHLAAAKSMMITAISFIATAMCLCVSLLCVIYRKQLDSSLCTVALFCTMQGMFTLQSFIRHTAELERSLVAVERVTAHNHITTEGSWQTPDSAIPDTLLPASGTIRFVKYSTTYHPDLKPALQDLTFTIHGKEKVGVVGRTGAGKTTLTLALVRLLEPRSGKIYIDDVDITKIGLHDLRSKVTVITQDPILFEGTIRDNLDPGGEHKDQELWEALEHAHLKDFISQYPGGLHWYCRDAGDIMSVGQRQLLCLARALLRNPKVLVLDEPTASVDVTTDRLVQDTLRNHLGHCTLLTIAHRLNTVIDYDRVMLIDAGRIIEFDKPSRLLEDKTSQFFSLAKESGLTT